MLSQSHRREGWPVKVSRHNSWLIYKWMPQSWTAHICVCSSSSETHFFPLNWILQVQLYAHCLLFYKELKPLLSLPLFYLSLSSCSCWSMPPVDKRPCRTETGKIAVLFKLLVNRHTLFLVSRSKCAWCLTFVCTEESFCFFVFFFKNVSSKFKCQ